MPFNVTFTKFTEIRYHNDIHLFYIQVSKKKRKKIKKIKYAHAHVNRFVILIS